MENIAVFVTAAFPKGVTISIVDFSTQILYSLWS